MHKAAYELVAEWEVRFGTKPSVIHYTCIISGCLRTKNYDLAWSAYELMCQSGVMPDETCITTLLPGLGAAQQWDRVLALVRNALHAACQVSIPTDALNNALSQMLFAGQVGRQATQ